MATTLATIATAHTFVLPVSHGLLFRQPRSVCDGTDAATSVSPNLMHCRICPTAAPLERAPKVNVAFARRPR
jgi:hypothetical protein